MERRQNTDNTLTEHRKNTDGAQFEHSGNINGMYVEHGRYTDKTRKVADFLVLKKWK